MSITGLSICVFTIHKAIVDIAMDDVTPEGIRKIRLNAVSSLPQYLSVYAKEGLNEDVIELVCEKKIEFILHANSQKEIREIMSPPRPRWYAGQVVCDSPYHINAEELLIWACYSPYNKMTTEAENRALYLFEKVFGCSVTDYAGGKPKGV